MKRFVYCSLSLFVGVFWSLSSMGSVKGSACTENYQKLKKAAIQTGQYKDSVCFLRISPLDIENSKYRSFIFTSEGEVFIFHSFKEGNEKENTGAQVFFLPGYNRKNFRYQETPEGQIQVHLPNLDTFTFAADVSGVSSATGQIKMATHFSKKHPKSVEMLSYKKAFVDLGFELGRSPKSISEGQSQLTNAQGKTCALKNAQIFDYAEPIRFKFRKATTWDLFVSRVCP